MRRDGKHSVVRAVRTTGSAAEVASRPFGSTATGRCEVALREVLELKRPPGLHCRGGASGHQRRWTSGLGEDLSDTTAPFEPGLKFMRKLNVHCGPTHSIPAATSEPARPASYFPAIDSRLLSSHIPEESR